MCNEAIPAKFQHQLGLEVVRARRGSNKICMTYFGTQPHNSHLALLHWSFKIYFC